MEVTAQRVPFVDLAAEHQTLREQLDDAVRRVTDSGRFVLGQELAAFEAEFASYCNVEHCVGVASGTDALLLALRACQIAPGDEVITPSLTFYATAFAVVAVGAVPVFVDVEDTTATLNLDLMREAITPRTRAILPVHLYGRCANLDGLAELAREHGLWLIEDAAQAHGARWNGSRAGAVGDVGCFSFYPSKNLGAWGDGGAVITSDARLAERVRLLRNYGQTQKYQHELLGANSRLDELQAAILRTKLPHLDAWNEARRSAASAYSELLDVALRPPRPEPSDGHVFHLYVVRTKERDALQGFLARQGVETGIHYPIPVHRQVAFRGVPQVARELPVTDELASAVLSLPMFPTISQDKIRFVADQVRAGLANIGS
jgi:dTDP-3-amino-3,4,6-trideoxy-alpha-D-glucose transaminase